MGDKVRCYVCKEQIDKTAGRHAVGVGWRCEKGCAPRRFQDALDASQAECERLRKVADAAAETIKRLDAMALRIGIDSVDYAWLTDSLREAQAMLTTKEKTDE